MKRRDYFIVSSSSFDFITVLLLFQKQLWLPKIITLLAHCISLHVNASS